MSSFKYYGQREFQVRLNGLIVCEVSEFTHRRAIEKASKSGLLKLPPVYDFQEEAREHFWVINIWPVIPKPELPDNVGMSWGGKMEKAAAKPSWLKRIFHWPRCRNQ